MDQPAHKVIDPRLHDLGGFGVRRVLPHLEARHVGPFVFFDHIGPAAFPPAHGIDVRPHPHIGLATVTYLFAGAIEHRDSLGCVQVIRPGDVNWMTAGRGIVHSERTPAPERAAGHALHGIQVWVALPRHAEETAPSFHHHGAETLPLFERGEVSLRLVLGTAYGRSSPVQTFSEMFYLGAEFAAGASLILPPEHAERGVYVAAGTLVVDGVEVPRQHLAVLAPGKDVDLRASDPVQAILFGGATLDGERHLWWNFVSSSRERIEQAKRDWLESRFGSVPGDAEFIPLPDR